MRADKILGTLPYFQKKMPKMKEQKTGVRRENLKLLQSPSLHHSNTPIPLEFRISQISHHRSSSYRREVQWNVN
jgi:hypothetical protein